jgi:hypothetical protein
MYTLCFLASNPESTTVTIYNANLTDTAFHAMCIYVFHAILRVNSNSFLKENCLLSNANAVFSVRHGRKRLWPSPGTITVTAFRYC